MITPATPPDEARRLQALRDLQILDTPNEERFDLIIRLAVRLFNVPIALVSLLDANRQWFKSCYGLTSSETSRDISFCGHAILADDILLIPDALNDERFKDNPLVLGDPFIRFYAGCPLIGPGGYKLGTLCLIDRVPREFSEDDRAALHDLARLVEKELITANLEGAMRTIRDSEQLNRALVEDLQQSEERYRQLFEENQAVKLLIDSETGQIVEANPAACRFYGYSPDQIVKLKISDINMTKPEEIADLREAAKNGDTTYFYFTVTHRLASGELRDVEVYTGPIRVKGRVLLYSIIHDITERNQVQRELKAQKDLTTNLFEQCAVAVIGINTRHEVILWNKAAELLSGYSAQEMLGRTDHWQAFYQQERPSLGDIMVDGAYDTIPRLYGDKARPSLHSPNAVHVEDWFLEVRGKRRYLAFDASPVFDADGQMVAAVTTMQDYTERKQIDEELKTQRDFALQVMSTMGQGLTVTRADGYFEYVNPVFSRMIGYSAEELSSRWLLDITFEQDSDRIRQIRQRRQNGETVNYEVALKRADGTALEVIITAVPRYLNGQIAGSIAVITDLTERKKVERLKTEFISTVSHELRTPLTSIRGSLGLVLGGVVGELPEAAVSMIEIAQKNSERLVRLINDILDVEKIESGKMVFQLKPIALEGLVAQAIEANVGYAQEYGVSFRFDSDVPTVKSQVDSDRLTQVVTNLLSNAAKFSPKGAEIVVSLREKAGVVRLEVRDQGLGISTEFKSRIFQKFAQADSSATRRIGGTGLGLSISKAIVERMDGKIGFEPNQPTGTIFWVELPGWIEAPISPPSRPARSRILVCEDNQDINTLLKMMLEDTGFKIDLAYSAAQARQFLAERGPQYLAMTLDLMLPDQDGVSFIRELRQHTETATLPIIVVSARAEAGQHELNGNALAVVDWIDKPIDYERLIGAVKQASQQKPDSKPHILHLEDDPDILKVVKRMLGTLAEVDQATTLGQARQQLDTRVFDLILLDLELPDGNGLELVNYLQDQNRLQIPVVVFSANEVGRDAAHKVAATLVKSRNSNQELVATIKALIESPKLAAGSVF